MCDKHQIFKWLKIILKNENFTVDDIDITGTSEKGENYIGDITFLIINTNNEKLSLVLKSGKQQEEIRKLIPINQAFSNEIFCYSKIFPEFMRFQEEKRVSNVFDNFPKCYGTIFENKNEVIILENLKKSGYDLSPRKKPMHRNVILKVLKSYGKFHALSLALKNQNFTKFKEMVALLRPIWLYMVDQDGYEEVHKFNIKECKSILTKKGVDQDKINKLDNMADNSILKQKFNLEERNVVIIHGDCWNNNFMFKFKDAEVSDCTNLKILDWQLSRLGSPVLDLSYFIFANSSSKELDTLEHLLKVYHDSLSSHLKELGCDAEEIFPFSELKKEWKKYAFYGVVLTPGFLKVETYDKEDVPDFENLKNVDVVELFCTESNPNEDYEQRVFEIMSHPEYQNLL